VKQQVNGKARETRGVFLVAQLLKDSNPGPLIKKLVYLKIKKGRIDIARIR
jgi:hypothetical protein